MAKKKRAASDASDKQPVFAITSDVPMPKHRGNAVNYPFGDLEEVGQSFFVPNGNPGSVRAAARRWKDENDSEARFMVRESEEDGVPGARVWLKEA